MILEIAALSVHPDKREEFLAGFKEALPIFRRAKGFIDLKLHEVLEDRGSFRLLIEWETVENHMTDFRQSEDFQKYRALVGHCLAQPSVVVHGNCVLKA